MTTRNLRRLLACSAILGLAATSGAAFAQAPAAAPAAAAASIPAGPMIAGVCIFSNEQAIGSSAVGKYVGTRLQQLQSAATAEVQADKTSIETDARALDAQRATLTADVLDQRTLSLRQRASALERKAEQRGRELDVTQQKALSRVNTEMVPLLRQVYAQRNCGLLLDRNSVFGSNPQMDVTADVVKLLDAKITQFPFDREHLDQQQAAAAPAAAPAAPRPAPRTQ